MNTTRLRLIPAAPAHLLALIEGVDAFEARSGLRPATGFGDFMNSGELSSAFMERLHAAAGDGPDPWHFGFFMLHSGATEVIGAASFKGPPDGDGVVEIAYGIVSAYQGQGYATEAAAALVNYARGTGCVKTVRAHTVRSNVASLRVLEKCGFMCRGEVNDPEDGLVLRWELPLELSAP